MADDNRQWLSKLKAGDDVAVYHSRSFYGRYDFTSVERESAKFLIVKGKRYRKEDGCEAGDRYSSCLVEPTLELKNEESRKAQRVVLERKLEDVRWRNLPLETLKAVDTILTERATPTATNQPAGGGGGDNER